MVEEAADHVWLFLAAVEVAASAVEELVWVARSAPGERGVLPRPSAICSPASISFTMTQGTLQFLLLQQGMAVVGVC